MIITFTVIAIVLAVGIWGVIADEREIRRNEKNENDN